MKPHRGTSRNVEDRITRGSGNVFADLGFSEPAELQVKAELTRRTERTYEFMECW